MTDVQIRPIHDGEFDAFFDVAAQTFGTQINDAIWTGFNPGWNTPHGASDCIERLRQRWLTRTKNKSGKDNTIFLVAISPDLAVEGKAIIAGVAIWQQLSVLEDWGDIPYDGPEQRALLNLPALWPSDEKQVKFLEQCEASLHSARVRTVREKQNEAVPAAFVLDLCAVLPDHQKRGIAQALVRWGLDEAKVRGGLECLTEASVMGRGAYSKLGFKELENVVYEVDDEFRAWQKPSNVFMRTQQ